MPGQLATHLFILSKLWVRARFLQDSLGGNRSFEIRPLGVVVGVGGFAGGLVATWSG